MTKVKMDVIRPWIANRATEFLGFEDEVLINFINELLEGKVCRFLFLSAKSIMLLFFLVVIGGYGCSVVMSFNHLSYEIHCYQLRERIRESQHNLY